MPRHAEILDLLWKDDDDDDENGTYLLGCTSLGQVVVWKMDDDNKSISISIAESGGEQQQEVEEVSRMNTKPIVTLDVSSKALRSIQIATTTTPMDDDDDNNCLLLFLAGDEGLWTIPWDDLLANNNKAPTKTIIDYGPIQQVHVYQNHLYILNTNNSTVFKVDSKTLQIVARYPPPPSNKNNNDVSATTFKVVKGSSSSCSNTTTNGGPLFLVGTTNSQVWIWDVTKNKALEPLHLLNDRHNKNYKHTNKAKTAAATSCTVTSICTNNENDLWWTIAGTLSHCGVPQQAAAEGVGGGGFVSTWHGPSRSLLSSCDTQESIHCLILSPNNDGALYSTGNHGIVTVWESPHQLTTEPHNTNRRRIWVSPPSGKALATSNTYKRVALAGVGPKVDILENHCRLFTLEL
jgi:hypothetical protein